MTCRGLTELVTDYLEGRLTWRERVAFQLHLGICRHCRAYLRQMRKTVRDLGRVPDLAIPADVQAELLQRFRQWHRDPRALDEGEPAEPEGLL